MTDVRPTQKFSEIILLPRSLVLVFTVDSLTSPFEKIKSSCEKRGLDPFYILWPRGLVTLASEEQLEHFALGTRPVKAASMYTDSIIFMFAPLKCRLGEGLKMGDVRMAQDENEIGLWECDPDVIIFYDHQGARIVKHRDGSWGPLNFDE